MSALRPLPSEYLYADALAKVILSRSRSHSELVHLLALSFAASRCSLHSRKSMAEQACDSFISKVLGNLNPGEST